MNKRKFAIKFFLGVVITSAATWWVARAVDGRAVTAIFERASIFWLAWGFVFYAAAYAARVGRFSSLFQSGSLSRNSLFAIAGVHSAAVRLLPNPAGEAVFFYLAKRHGADGTRSLAILFIYRLFDFAVAAFFLSLSGFWVLESGWFGAKILFALPIAFIALSPFFIAWLLSRGGGPSWLPLWILTFWDELEHLAASGSAWRRALGYSLLLWACMSLSYYMFFRAFGITFDFLAVVFGGMVQVFVNVLPSIGGVGVMEAGWVAGLGLAHAPREAALMGAIGVDAMTLLGTLLIGGVALLGMLVKRAKERRMGRLGAPRISYFP